MNYYNEINPFAAQWLRNLIVAGAIPEGHVDERDIRDVSAADLDGYEQVHLFAGIGGWPLAIELSGWTGPVWTASCPCPIVSLAKGSKHHCPDCDATNPVWLPDKTGWAACGMCGREWEVDKQHLWPEVWRLVRKQRPAVLFGEQVAERRGASWWSCVQWSMEMAGYAVGSAILPATIVGAHHRRYRRFYVCMDESKGQATLGREQQHAPSIEGDCRGGVAERSGQNNVVHAVAPGLAGQSGLETRAQLLAEAGFPDWRDIVLIECQDRQDVRFRPVPAAQPLIHPLAYGLPKNLGKGMPALQRLANLAGADRRSIARARRYRIGSISGYGNAIVPQLAAKFIKAAMI